MLMNMANSITVTNNTGNDTDLSTNRIIINISMIDTALTRLKSVSVIFIKSLVHGASPITMALLSYSFTIPSISFI